MKKNNTCPKSSKGSKTRKRSITIGMDLGDKSSHYWVTDGDDQERDEAEIW